MSCCQGSPETCSAEPVVELLETSAGAVAVRVGKSVAVMARDRGHLDRVEMDTRSDLECWVLDLRAWNGV